MTKVRWIVVRVVVIVLSVLGCTNCRDLRVQLPGELVLSRYGWDRVAYFDGIHYHEVIIHSTAETSFVSGAQIGPGRATYAVSYPGPLKEGGALGNSIVKIDSNGFATVIVKPSSATILDFASTSEALIVLNGNENGCPTVIWTSYEGIKLRSLPAPCNATTITAAASDKLVVSAGTESFLLTGDRFEPIKTGSNVTSINPNELVYYTEEDQCIWKYQLKSSHVVRIVCGELFVGAASYDARYIAVRILTVQDLHDMPELRVVDTESKRHVRVLRGPIPHVHWSLPTQPT